MSEQEVYRRFINWLNQTWWGLPEADELMPLIMARYTPEEAAPLTGMPFSGKNLEELAEMKGMDPVELDPQLHELAKKGIVFRTERGETVCYSLNDTFFEQCSKKIDCLKFNQKNSLYILDHSECFLYNPFIKNGNL